MGEQIRGFLGEGVGRVGAFLPSLISAVVIFAVGYLVSRLAGGLLRRLLVRAGFDRLAARHFRGMERQRSASSMAGSALFWLGMLVTISMASNSLGLVTLSAGINRILGFIPNVLVACVIVGVAIPVARLLAGMVGSVAGPAVARIAQVAIVVLASFMALDQLGISSTIVTTTFTALLGAAAVAAAIAFGVGNIGLARDLSKRWARRGEETAREAKLERPSEEPRYDVEPPFTTEH